MEEVNARAEISRLRTQLADIQKKLRQNVAKKKKDLRQADVTDHVERAFKLAGDLQDERNKVVQENAALKVRLQDAEKLHQNEDYKRSKFMQGAAWQATKALQETKDLEAKIAKLVKEFKDHERNLYLKDDQIGLELFREKNQEIVLEEVLYAVQDSSKSFKKMMEDATGDFLTSHTQVDTLGGAGSHIPY